MNSRTKMTSRERIRAVLNYQEADRIPIDIGGTKVTGVHVDEYIEIGQYLGLDIELPKVYDQFQMLARVEGFMLNWFHSDVIQVENLVESWGFKNRNWKPWITTCGNRVLMPGEFNPILDQRGYICIKDKSGKAMASMAPEGKYFDRECQTSMSDEFVKMDPEEWKRSIPLYSDEELKTLEKNARFLHENTDYSIHGGFNKGKLGSSGVFAGHTFTDWLCILACEREYAYSILQATAEAAVENLKLYLQAVGRYIDTILISTSDFGTQKAEIFSPDIFKEVYAPNYKVINDYVHTQSSAKTMFHSCGSIRKIIKDFIDAGVDILNPVQANASNMDPVELKQEFGHKIVFWGGGIDTQTVLPYGTIDEVREQVKERIGALAVGGGAVFAPVHNIQHGVPPQNVEAMINAVLEYGQYPISE